MSPSLSKRGVASLYIPISAKEAWLLCDPRLWEIWAWLLCIYQSQRKRRGFAVNPVSEKRRGFSEYPSLSKRGVVSLYIPVSVKGAWRLCNPSLSKRGVASL